MQVHNKTDSDNSHRVSLVEFDPTNDQQKWSYSETGKAIGQFGKDEENALTIRKSDQKLVSVPFKEGGLHKFTYNNIAKLFTNIKTKQSLSIAPGSEHNYSNSLPLSMV